MPWRQQIYRWHLPDNTATKGVRGSAALCPAGCPKNSLPGPHLLPTEFRVYKVITTIHHIILCLETIYDLPKLVVLPKPDIMPAHFDHG